MHTRTVRVARPDDLAGVDALLARSYPRLLKPHYPASTLVMAVPLIARAKPELLRSGRYFVVEAAGQIVGAGGWSADRGLAGLGHIRHVATDPDAVRLGIGRALMGAVLAQAQAAGISGLHCLSTRMAVPFYAALGFRELREASIPLAPGISFPAVLMRRGDAPVSSAGGPGGTA